MYCNFSIYPSFLQPQDLFFLYAVKQVNTEINIPEDTLQRFSDNNLIMWIKGKPKEEQRLKIRLSEAGKKLMEDLETPHQTEGDLAMYEYLKNTYLSNGEDRSIGNEKLTKIYCAQFRQILGLSLHQMYWLCMLFVERVEFTRVLENIFFVKKDNPYGKFKDNVDSSKLYIFYNENKKEVEQFWAQKIKTEG